MKTTRLRGYSITRRDNAEGTNLVDKSQPVVSVYGHGMSELMGSWTLLCLPDGHVTADKATDEQIVRSIETDEPIF